MKNVGFLLIAIMLSPVVIATGMLIIIVSYFMYPLIIVGTLYALFKINEAMDAIDEEEKKNSC